ncbi:MAG: type III pantothenate kinase [Candidatus Omnitrophica bacterium]|nr:type III pantothenate kinase [Candidatus Omnitrophota bacterium]
MLLTVDVGNTNINLGLFEERLKKKFSFPTRQGRFRAKLKRIFSQNKVDDAIVCSVVPWVTAVMEENLKRLLGIRPYIIGKDVNVPVKNLYRKPRQVGQDRLVNAYAAVMLYGAPLIAVDFGTAITFDVVSKNKEYLGGMILPGLSLSLEALNQRTALLPKVKLVKPREFIGRETRSSMLSGIVHGFAALTDEFIRRIRKEIGKDAKVICTGGNAGLVSKYSVLIDKVDEDLTLKGMNLIYKSLSA